MRGCEIFTILMAHIATNVPNFSEVTNVKLHNITLVLILDYIGTSLASRSIINNINIDKYRMIG